eukprot:g68475.t1
MKRNPKKAWSILKSHYRAFISSRDKFSGNEDEFQSAQVHKFQKRKVPEPHSSTTKQADCFVQEMENIPLVLLRMTEEALPTFTSHSGTGSLLDYVFCPPHTVLRVTSYFTWPSYMIPFSDHNLVTFDISDWEFSCANASNAPTNKTGLMFVWKRKVDLSNLAESFAELPKAYESATPIDILGFFYSNRCPIIDRAAKKTNTKVRSPGFITHPTLNKMKSVKNMLLRKLKIAHERNNQQEKNEIIKRLKECHLQFKKALRKVRSEKHENGMKEVAKEMTKNPGRY